jgi:twinkle protein
LNFQQFDEHKYNDRTLLEFLGRQESQNIAWGDAYTDELLDYFRHQQVLTGAKLPWAKTHDRIRFRPGEVTIHAGMNGHRKSMVCGQIMQWFALQGEPAGIMSFEMPVRDTQKRMCQQAAGSYDPTENFIRDWAQWNHRTLAYYDKLDTIPSARVLGALYFMAQEWRCKHILIDSLTKCGLPYGERGAEKDFIDALCATAKAFQIHIHLVCHVRKPEKMGEAHIPTKFDVRGAGELTDLVDNVIIHWADKKKIALQQLRKANKRLEPKEVEYLENRPDQRLVVAKQRNGEYEGSVGLHFGIGLQFNEGRQLPFQFPRGKERVA